MIAYIVIEMFLIAPRERSGMVEWQSQIMKLYQSSWFLLPVARPNIVIGKSHDQSTFQHKGKDCLSGCHLIIA